MIGARACDARGAARHRDIRDAGARRAADDFSRTPRCAVGLRRARGVRSAVSRRRSRETALDRARRTRLPTQLARALGLQRKFAAADAALDGVQAALDPQPPRVRVRYLLERGRVRNTSGAAQHAVPLFNDALAASARDTLPGADFYRVDALHMLGIAAPAGEQLDWNLKALAAADASTDARTRGWRASLLNNIGWTYSRPRRTTSARSIIWQKALAAREAAGDVVQHPRCPVDGRARPPFARPPRRSRKRSSGRSRVRLEARLRAPTAMSTRSWPRSRSRATTPAAAKPWAAKAYALLKDDAARGPASPRACASRAGSPAWRSYLSPAKRRAAVRAPARSRSASEKRARVRHAIRVARGRRAVGAGHRQEREQSDREALSGRQHARSRSRRSASTA